MTCNICLLGINTTMFPTSNCYILFWHVACLVFSQNYVLQVKKASSFQKSFYTVIDLVYWSLGDEGLVPWQNFHLIQQDQDFTPVCEIIGINPAIRSTEVDPCTFNVSLRVCFHRSDCRIRTPSSINYSNFIILKYFCQPYRYF